MSNFNELREVGEELDKLEGKAQSIDLIKEDKYYTQAEQIYIEAKNAPTDELLTRRKIDINPVYLKALNIFTIQCMLNEEEARTKASQKIKH